jgi:hypothetical protein
MPPADGERKVRVVAGEHGWWQGCDQLAIVGSDSFDANGANFNLTVDATVPDPVSGTPSHRSSLCEVQVVEESSQQPGTSEQARSHLGLYLTSP